ncbi:MAG: hypothetical protein AAF589_09545 [Planctomycetota bacterium]
MHTLFWSAPEVGGFGWSEAAVDRLHAGLALFWLVAAAVIAWRPVRPLVACVLGLQVGIAGLMAWTGEGFRLAVPNMPTVESWLAGAFPLFSQSCRFAAPLGLLALTRAGGEPSDSRVQRGAIEFLRWAAIATFAAHGVEALQHYPKFIDMLISATRLLSGATMSQGVAEGLLTVIGAADVLVAVVVAAKRSQRGAGYMAVWGLITAASRVVVYGVFLGGWGFLTRAPHAIVPVVLWVLWRSELTTGQSSAEEIPTGDHAKSPKQNAMAAPHA